MSLPTVIRPAARNELRNALTASETVWPKVLARLLNWDRTDRSGTEEEPDGAEPEAEE